MSMKKTYGIIWMGCQMMTKVDFEVGEEIGLGNKTCIVMGYIIYDDKNVYYDVVDQNDRVYTECYLTEYNKRRS
jgi:hypothetical protein